MDRDQSCGWDSPMSESSPCEDEEGSDDNITEHEPIAFTHCSVSRSMLVSPKVRHCRGMTKGPFRYQSGCTRAINLTSRWRQPLLALLEFATWPAVPRGIENKCDEQWA